MKQLEDWWREGSERHSDDAESGRRRAIESAIVFMLHESRREARRIAAGARRSMGRTVDLWRDLGEESVERTLARVERVDAMGIEQLAAYLAAKKERGVALLTIHLGSYLLGILRLVGATGQRRLIFLRRERTGTTDFEARAFAKLEALGVRFEVVRLGGRGVWRVVRGLREGAVAVLLYDLPARWGPTTPVDVLGMSMSWVRGPFELIVRSKAIAIPFFCFDAASRERDCRLAIGRVVDLDREGVAPAVGVHHAAQQFADAATLAIRTFPEQWHHWTLVGEMTRGTVSA